jgi:hypothetical protein
MFPWTLLTNKTLLGQLNGESSGDFLQFIVLHTEYNSMIKGIAYFTGSKARQKALLSQNKNFLLKY